MPYFDVRTHGLNDVGFANGRLPPTDGGEGAARAPL